MNGMIAENKQREVQGDSMAYTEKDFIDLIEEHRIHSTTCFRVIKVKIKRLFYCERRTSCVQKNI